LRKWGKVAHIANQKCVQNFTRKTAGQIPFWRYRHKWADNNTSLDSVYFPVPGSCEHNIEYMVFLKSRKIYWQIESTVSSHEGFWCL